MKTEPLSIHIAALIDEIIQWKIEMGDLPEVLNKKREPKIASKNEAKPFILPEFYDWIIQELDGLSELPHNLPLGETS